MTAEVCRAFEASTTHCHLILSELQPNLDLMVRKKMPALDEGLSKSLHWER